MKTKTINIIYIVALIVIISGGVFLLYGDVYFWITGNRLGNSNAPQNTEDQKSQIPTIDTNALSAKIDGDKTLLLLDVRTSKEYESGHIKQAVSLPLDQIDNQIGKLELAKNQEIITMCDGKGCNRADQAAAKLIGLGFSNVASYHDGITAWQLAGKPVVTTSLDPNDFIDLFKDFKTQEISPQDTYRKIAKGNVIIIDVQTQGDYQKEHLSGSVYVDLFTVAAKATSGVFPKNKTIIFYSEDGTRSKIATGSFLEHGYKDVFSMTGGINAWKGIGNASTNQ